MNSGLDVMSRGVCRRRGAFSEKSPGGFSIVLIIQRLLCETVVCVSVAWLNVTVLHYL